MHRLKKEDMHESNCKNAHGDTLEDWISQSTGINSKKICGFHRHVCKKKQWRPCGQNRVGPISCVSQYKFCQRIGHGRNGNGFDRNHTASVTHL